MMCTPHKKSRLKRTGQCLKNHSPKSHSHYLHTQTHTYLRRRRYSNPRYLAVQRFSRPPHSTTLPLLQSGAKIRIFSILRKFLCSSLKSYSKSPLDSINSAFAWFLAKVIHNIADLLTNPWK